MQCLSCEFENPEGVNFCEKCGAKLVPACPSCGQEVRPTAKFCGGCGTALAERRKRKRRIGESGKRREGEPLVQTPDTRRQTLDASREAREAERRQLTVMFCDLVGSTALSAQLDPEELREVVQAYQETCTSVIQRYEGYIAQHMGDGLLVYFGYPAAHEDDAQRAIRTGLGILAALQALNRHVRHPLQVRIGIHTGLVVVGEIGSGARREQLALGETPNLAARLQAVAEPDTVVISGATQRLVAGLFTCRSLGLRELKGLTTPLEVYQVLGAGEMQSRFEVAVTRGLTPLVGREQEIGLLLDHWERATAGEGQVVLLSGEPGIGKSRLLQALTERLTGETYARVECRCSPFYQNSALYPVIEHLQRLLRFTKDETPQEKVRKLESTLQHYGLPLPEVVPLFATLLSLSLPEHYPPLTLSPQKQKQKTLEALVSWLLQEAGRQPVRLDVEDLHWADPSTLEFLGLLIDQVPTARLLVLLTYRPELRPPWPPHSHVTQLTLRRLVPKQAEVMVQKAIGGKTLPAEVLQQVVAKTDGVPLFVEELTKTVLESGLLREANGHYELMGPLPPLAIPATLQDSLMARLDRLATAKEVAQLGATLGREFAYELLRAVSAQDETSLQQALAKLVEAEVLYQRGLPPQARYFFKHALIQDTAYQSLLKSTRQQYHQQIAQVLEGRFMETTETQPELLAHHYTEAGLAAQAIPYWQQVGQRAVERSAYVEASSHLLKGLELLKAQPDTPARIRQEVALQTTLGSAWMATKGYAAPEVERAYARARELCQHMEDTSQLFPVLWGLAQFYLVRAEYQTAHDLGERLLRLAQHQQDPAFLLEAHRGLAGTLFLLGELVPTRAHLEQGMNLYNLQQHRSHAFLYNHDPAVVCLTLAAAALWHLGYPDQALQKVHEALTLAQELAHPFSLAWALAYAAIIHQYRREGRLVQEQAEAAITLCANQGFPLWLAGGMYLRGWALAEEGQGEEGIAQIHQGISAYLATGAELARSYQFVLLAEAYAKGGQPEKGLSALAEGLAVVDKTRERPYEPELYRLKGELTLQKAEGSRQKADPSTQHLTPSTPAEAEAEACFHKAIEVARKQSAKSCELRASTSLARLWQRQGKKAEARQLLAEIYDWFTEGFDTKDLQEAKALLQELA